MAPVFSNHMVLQQQMEVPFGEVLPETIKSKPKG
jgi:hypothetical protein